MNKKYLPSALILYLNYFIHGVGCSILGQQSSRRLSRLHGECRLWLLQLFQQPWDLDVLSHFRLQDLYQISSDAVSQQQSEAALMLST